VIPGVARSRNQRTGSRRRGRLRCRPDRTGATDGQVEGPAWPLISPGGNPPPWLRPGRMSRRLCNRPHRPAARPPGGGRPSSWPHGVP
jgi:hypothetical protein